MGTILDAIMEYAKRLPPKWRAPVLLAVVVVGALGYVMVGDGYETQAAHAADIQAVRAEMQNLPTKVVEALDARDVAKKKRRK